MPPNRFESEVGNFLEGSHGDRTHIKRAGHHTVTPLCGTLLRTVGLIPAHAGKTYRFPRSGSRPRAHPRSRGENIAQSRSYPGHCGSSPLTRGKRERCQPLETTVRLIPAHAGKTVKVSVLAETKKAHPRSRGENATGLPEPGTGHRLIPAHAGKTTVGTQANRAPRAHPRSRGENACASAPMFDTPGSSPLTRGKPANTRDERDGTGLIPAHAGKTDATRMPGELSRAHPRSRGENSSASQSGGCEWGSSPLTRGKPPIYQDTSGYSRLIPAHAGKTSTS